MSYGETTGTATLERATATRAATFNESAQNFTGVLSCVFFLEDEES